MFALSASIQVLDDRHDTPAEKDDGSRACHQSYGLRVGTLGPDEADSRHPGEDPHERFGLPAAFERQPRDGLDGPLQIVLDSRSTFEIDHVNGYPVVPRDGPS